jgi:hypothetical protein
MISGCEMNFFHLEERVHSDVTFFSQCEKTFS